MANTLLEIQRLTNGVIAKNSNVVFDTTKLISGNISYDDATGTITFTAPGTYVVNWWVSTATSLSVEAHGFALVTSQGDTIEADSPIKTGEIAGGGIFVIQQAGITMSLINVTPVQVVLADNVPVSAFLMLFQQDLAIGEIGPTGPTGATATIIDPQFIKARPTNIVVSVVCRFHCVSRRLQ